ncbi:MAG: pyridoxal phosphate-dependent aminotransferase [Candidatus Baldrarchaeia archaeon]
MIIRRIVRREILNMHRPQHGGDIWQYDNIEDFSSNINPLGPPAEIKEFVLNAIDKLQYYPDDSATRLKETISNRFDIPTDLITVGSGSVELIRLFSEVFIDRGDKVLIPQPTFEEYAFSSKLMGGRIIRIPLNESENFRINFELLFEKITPSIRAVFICNPNNPTSRVEPKKKILELVEECEREGVLVFLDEALIDLVEGSERLSCLKEVESHENLFVLRSLTKAFAIPGLRVGYGIGSREIIKFMENARLSWNVGQIEQIVAARLIDECYEHIKNAIRVITSEKRRIFGELLAMRKHITAYYPDANFFFVNIAGLGIKSREFKHLMLRYNILVRDCTSFGPPCENYTRFSIKTAKSNTKLVKALRSIITELNSRHR